MSLPGWYLDPSGQLGHYRYWNGHQWSAVTTTNPTDPPPGLPLDQPPPANRAGRITLAAVLAAALIVTFFWWAPWKPPIEEQKPTPPSLGPSSAPSSAAVLDCTQSNGAGMPGEQDYYVGGGLKYTAVPDFGFRFDATQWGWLDDLAAWGQQTPQEGTAGIVLGGVRKEYGFGPTPKAAVNATKQCLTKFGPWNDQPYEFAKASGREVKVAGMKGWEYTAVVVAEDSTRGDQLTILILDAGQPQAFGVFISFFPEGDTVSGAKINRARQSLRRA